MEKITNPTLTTKKETIVLKKEHENELILKFIKDCQEGDLEKVISQLKNNIIKETILKNNYKIYIAEALNVAYIKGNKEFVKNFIKNDTIKELLDFKLNDNLNEDTIFKNICEKKHTDLLNFLIEDDEIIKQLSNDTIEGLLGYLCLYGYKDNAIKLLNKDYIFEKISKERAAFIISDIIINPMCKIDKNIKNDIIESIINNNLLENSNNKEYISRVCLAAVILDNNKLYNHILENKNLREQVDEDPLTKTIMKLTVAKNFDLLKNILNDSVIMKKIKDSLVYKPIENTFAIICKNKDLDSINLFLNNDYIKDNFLIRIFDFACENEKAEAIETLINYNDEIFEKIKNSEEGIIYKTFYLACEDKKINLINTLINNEKTRNEIPNEIIEDCFKQVCEKKNLDMVKLFLENEKLRNVIDINNESLKNIFTNILIKEEELDRKEIELSILFLKNNIEPGEGIDNNNYKKVKNKIGKLIEVLVEDKNELKTIQKNIENIKTGKGYKEFIKKNEKVSHAENWKNNTPLQKTLLSLEKIKNEFEFEKQKQISKS